MSQRNFELHDSYDFGVSSNRVVTRSQTCFNRIHITPSALQLFADKSRHEIPGHPHLLDYLKGPYGSVPRTIITRSTGKNLQIDEELNAGLRAYKDAIQSSIKPKEEQMVHPAASQRPPHEQALRMVPSAITPKEEQHVYPAASPRPSQAKIFGTVPQRNFELHDSYDFGVSSNRIVTRSQTCFNRIRITPSTLQLFSDKSRHEIPGHPHLLDYLKGPYGSVPRTIITRSTGKNLQIDEELNAGLRAYKDAYSQPAVKKETIQVKMEE